MALRLARTNEEAHLYMDLHPCGCGEVEFPRSSSVVETADGLAGRYVGPCPRDGARREFTFRLPQRLVAPPRAGAVSYGGGAEPSELIDPGEWLSVADAYARSVPAHPASAADAGPMLRRAVAAIDEVLKFIPAGADRVPESAFVTDRGRAAYAKEPGRFRRPRLEAVRGTYANLAAQVGASAASR